MKKVLLCILIIAALLFFGFYIYVEDYYHTDEESVAAFLTENNITVRELDDGSVAYIPDDAVTGVIFYPGGKVEHTAYEPLMRALADRGILAVLIKMPCNLAVLKSNAADGIPEEFPEVDSWYMAGHSLGGSMAASYAAKNTDSFDGLILLAAYSTADVSDTALRVASIYGTNDGVMNREKYEEYIKNLPTGTEETVLDGANHAGFGMYGEQKGDGKAVLSNAEQIKMTADIIADFVE